MATMSVLTAHKFLPSLPSTSSSNNHSTRKPHMILCKATANDSNNPSAPSTSSRVSTSRRGISVNLIAASTLLLAGASESIAMEPKKLLEKTVPQAKGKETTGGIVDKARELKGKGEDSAGNVVDKAMDARESAMEKVKGAAGAAADKAKEIAGGAKENAQRAVN